MTLRPLSTTIFLALASLHAGEAPPIQDNLSTSTRTEYQPLSAQERWQNYVKDAFRSPAPFFAAVMPALGDHQRTEPSEYGQGWDAFGSRLGRRAAQFQLQTALYHSSAAALGSETGYRPCKCSGAGRRLLYALTRTVLTKTRTRTTTPNFAYLGGVVGGSAIATELWYPDRYRATAQGVRAAGFQVGANTAVNVFREFGPELKKLFRRR